MESLMIAAAMLFHGDELLMMKRSMTRTINPGMWAAVGGHMEQEEIGSPKEACYREIFEETGFAREDVGELTLRYILLRNKNGELRQQFIYSGHVKRRDFVDTDEGTLHWIPLGRVLDREIPYIYRKALKHYMSVGPQQHAWVGVANYDERQQGPRIDWVPLSDPNY
jgi:8-oxo-dGTP diphosphatase